MRVAIKFPCPDTFLIYPNRDLSAKPLTVQTLLDFSRMTAAASRTALCALLASPIYFGAGEMSIYFYRVTDTFDEHGAIASLVAYESVKETPKGYWVKPKGSCNWMEFAHMRKVKMARWISKTSTKRLAYPTIKEAVDSFRRRKYRQLERLKAQLEVCELAVNNPRIIASDLELSDFPHDEFRLGAMESTRGWVFDF